MSEQLLEGAVGDDRGAVLTAVRTDRTHEHAFVHGVEETPEGPGAVSVYRDGAAFFAGAAALAGVGGGWGVGVDDPK